MNCTAKSSTFDNCTSVHNVTMMKRNNIIFPEFPVVEFYIKRATLFKSKHYVRNGVFFKSLPSHILFLNVIGIAVR